LKQGPRQVSTAATAGPRRIALKLLPCWGLAAPRARPSPPTQWGSTVGIRPPDHGQGVVNQAAGKWTVTWLDGTGTLGGPSAVQSPYQGVIHPNVKAFNEDAKHQVRPVPVPGSITTRAWPAPAFTICGRTWGSTRPDPSAAAPS